MIEQALRSVRKSIDWLLYTREELGLRERDRRIHALLGKDTITSREFLEADFGTKNPHGLDITSYPDHTSRVRPLTAQDGFDQLSRREQKKELSMALGRGGADDRIYLHPGFYDAAYRRRGDRQISNTFSHEHIHRLQAEERDAGWFFSSFLNGNMFFIHARIDETGIAGKARTLYQSFTRAVLDWRTERETKLSVSSYFSKEVEIQARLHEILVQGYAGWQRMPASKIELWAALHNMGMKAPVAIMEELRQSEDGQKALKDFRASPVLRRTASDEIRDLNRVGDYAIFEHNRETLWRRALPAIYGNLLELYGDSPGRARMGLGTNPASAIRMLREIGSDPAVAIDPSRVAGMADAVNPEHTNSLILSFCHMLSNKPDPVRESNVLAVTNALLARPEILASLNQDGDCRTEPIPALVGAVRLGSEPMIKCLVSAGANPLTMNRSADFPDGSFHLMDMVLWFRDLEAASRDRAAISSLDASRAIKKSIAAIFNDASKREQTEHGIILMRRGLEALGRYAPDIDSIRSFTRSDGSRVEASVRSLLEIAKIEPSRSVIREPADPGVPARIPA